MLACTRRDALGLTLGALLPACRSRREPTPEASSSALSTADSNTPPFGGLEVTSGGDLQEDERGGTAVVLLHGFGASGDDLVSLARSLVHPRTRYVVPAGLLELPNGGRAWWPLKQRLGYNAEQELLVPSEELARPRAAVQGVFKTIRERYAPEALLVAGFSQGAMLALDAALQPSSGVQRVAVLSGALPAVTSLALAKPPGPRPRVFVSHGRQDRILRFAGAEHAVERLKSAGLKVDFLPFDGGHEISPSVVEALREFLFAS